jgi:hypothetical protein
MKPKLGVNTSIKGWMNNKDNLRYDERVEVTRGLKKDVTAANIILNFSNKTVEKNGFNGDKDFRSLFKYFFGGYHQYITQVMSQLDPEYLKEILDELEAEMKEAQAKEEAKEDAPVPAE